MRVLELVKRIQAITNKNSVFTQLRSPNKNNVFTRSNSRDPRPILKTYCFLRQVVVFPWVLDTALSTSWLFKPRITPVQMLSMHSGSFTNGSFACHAQWTLWVRWMRTSILTMRWSYSKHLDNFCLLLFIVFHLFSNFFDFSLCLEYRLKNHTMKIGAY